MRPQQQVTKSLLERTLTLQGPAEGRIMEAELCSNCEHKATAWAGEPEQQLPSALYGDMPIEGVWGLGTALRPVPRWGTQARRGPLCIAG